MFFNINEHFIFNSENEKLNIISNNDGSFNIEGVETVIVSTEHNRVITLTRGHEGSDLLYGFSLDGKLIFRVEPPEHYNYWYLGKVDKVACFAADELAEKSPLSGWWFSINLNTGELTKGAPAY